MLQWLSNKCRRQYFNAAGEIFLNWPQLPHRNTSYGAREILARERCMAWVRQLLKRERKVGCLPSLTCKSTCEKDRKIPAWQRFPFTSLRGLWQKDSECPLACVQQCPRRKMIFLISYVRREKHHISLKTFVRYPLNIEQHTMIGMSKLRYFTNIDFWFMVYIPGKFFENVWKIS